MSRRIRASLLVSPRAYPCLCLPRLRRRRAEEVTRPADGRGLDLLPRSRSAKDRVQRSGHGRPVPGGAPSYNVKLFTLDGAFIGTSHLIRADLYHGQPCPQTGGLYFFIPPLGYYRCEHF